MVKYVWGSCWTVQAMASFILDKLAKQQGRQKEKAVPATVFLNGSTVENTATKNWKRIKDTARGGKSKDDAESKVFRFITKVFQGRPWAEKCADSLKNPVVG